MDSNISMNGENHQGAKVKSLFSKEVGLTHKFGCLRTSCFPEKNLRTFGNSEEQWSYYMIFCFREPLPESLQPCDVNIYWGLNFLIYSSISVWNIIPINFWKSRYVESYSFLRELYYLSHGMQFFRGLLILKFILCFSFLNFLQTYLRCLLKSSQKRKNQWTVSAQQNCKNEAIQIDKSLDVFLK